MVGLGPLWLLLLVLPLLLAVYAQARVVSVYGRYTLVPSTRGLSGAEVARRLLHSTGLEGVRVEAIAGRLSDHYDPRAKVLRLSRGVYHSPSVAAVSIAAHEVAHALQDAEGYGLMRLRHNLVSAAVAAGSLTLLFLLLGALLGSLHLVAVGVACFAALAAFHLVTLPVELNASLRARRLLAALGLVTPEEARAVRQVLTAAALTYTTVFLQALGGLLYFLFLGVRRD